MAASTFDNRCRFAVELESLGVLCLLPAQATQVDNKEMLLYIHYTKRFALFQGEKYSNRNKLSLLAGFVLVEKIAGKETRQQHVARFEDHLFPLKNAKILRCAVGMAQETGWSWPAIFFQTQKWPFKNRDPPTGLGPTTVPSKIRVFNGNHFTGLTRKLKNIC